MSKRDNLLLIEDMVRACKRIREYTHGLSFEEFVADEKTIDATARNIQILGEAAKKVSREMQEKYPSIEWTKIIRSRHILVHDYFELDHGIIWNIIQVYIPPLQEALARILHDHSSPS